MASTSAVVYLKLRPEDSTFASRTTTATVFMALRASTGQFTSGQGIAATRNLRNLRSYKPHDTIPVVDSKGYITHDWKLYFKFLDNQFLEAGNGPTLPDVIAAITTAQSNTVVSEQTAASLLQQIGANAQTLQALLEVVRATAAPGVEQVPPVQLAPVFTPTGSGGLTGGGDSAGGGGDSGGGSGGGGGAGGD